MKFIIMALALMAMFSTASENKAEEEVAAWGGWNSLVPKNRVVPGHGDLIKKPNRRVNPFDLLEPKNEEGNNVLGGGADLLSGLKDKLKDNSVLLEDMKDDMNLDEMKDKLNGDVLNGLKDKLNGEEEATEADEVIMDEMSGNNEEEANEIIADEEEADENMDEMPENNKEEANEIIAEADKNIDKMPGNIEEFGSNSSVDAGDAIDVVDEEFSALKKKLILATTYGEKGEAADILVENTNDEEKEDTAEVVFEETTDDEKADVLAEETSEEAEEDATTLNDETTDDEKADAADAALEETSEEDAYTLNEGTDDEEKADALDVLANNDLVEQAAENAAKEEAERQAIEAIENASDSQDAEEAAEIIAEEMDSEDAMEIIADEAGEDTETVSDVASLIKFLIENGDCESYPVMCSMTAQLEDMESLPELIEATADKFGPLIEKVLDQFDELEGVVAMGIAEDMKMFHKAREAIQNAVSADVTFIKEMLESDEIKSFEDLISTLEESVSSADRELGEKMSEFEGKIAEDAEGYEERMQEEATKLRTAVMTKIGELKPQIMPVVARWKEEIERFLESAGVSLEDLIGMVKHDVQSVKDAVEVLEAAVDGDLPSMMALIADGVSAIYPDGAEMIEDIAKDVLEACENMKEMYGVDMLEVLEDMHSSSSSDSSEQTDEEEDNDEEEEERSPLENLRKINRLMRNVKTGVEMKAKIADLMNSENADDVKDKLKGLVNTEQGAEIKKQLEGFMKDRGVNMSELAQKAAEMQKKAMESLSDDECMGMGVMKKIAKEIISRKDNITESIQKLAGDGQNIAKLIMATTMGEMKDANIKEIAERVRETMGEDLGTDIDMAKQLKETIGNATDLTEGVQERSQECLGNLEDRLNLARDTIMGQEDPNDLAVRRVEELNDKVSNQIDALKGMLSPGGPLQNAGAALILGAETAEENADDEDAQSGVNMLLANALDQKDNIKDQMMQFGGWLAEVAVGADEMSGDEEQEDENSVDEPSSSEEEEDENSVDEPSSSEEEEDEASAEMSVVDTEDVDEQDVNDLSEDAEDATIDEVTDSSSEDSVAAVVEPRTTSTATTSAVLIMLLSGAALLASSYIGNPCTKCKKTFIIGDEIHVNLLEDQI